MAATLDIVIKGQNKAGQAMQQVQRELGDIGRAADTAGTQTSGFFSNLVSTAGGVLTAGVFEKIGGGFLSAVSSGFAFNNSMEQVTAQLNAFTKDGGLSAKILEDIKKEASTTPFEFEAMAKATAALLPVSKQSGAALMDLVKVGEILAASNPAEGLEGAAYALKEAVSGDFTSIIERFNLPRQRLNELKEQGVPALEAVQIAMKELGLDSDLVANMANTASGRMSTFKDTLTNLYSVITQPMFDAFSNGLAVVNTWLEANSERIIGFASAISAQLGGAIDYVKGLFTSITGDSASGPGGFVAALAKVSPAIQVLRGMVDAALPPIRDIVQQVFGFISTFVQANSESIKTFVQNTWQTIQEIINGVLPPIQQIISTVFGAVAEFLRTHGDEIQSFLQNAWTQISGIISNVLEIIKATVVPAMQWIAGFLSEHSTEIQSVLSVAWGIIKTTVETVLGVISGLIKTILAVVKGDWEGAWTEIKNIFSTIWEGIQKIISDVVPRILEGAKNVGKAIMQGIQAGAEALWGQVSGWFSRKMDELLAKAAEVLSISSPSKAFANKIGAPIMQGIQVGVLKALPQTKDVIGKAVKGLIPSVPLIPQLAGLPGGPGGGGLSGLPYQSGGELSGLPGGAMPSRPRPDGLGLMPIDGGSTRPRPSAGGGGGRGDSYTLHISGGLHIHKATGDDDEALMDKMIAAIQRHQREMMRR